MRVKSISSVAFALIVVMFFAYGRYSRVCAAAPDAAQKADAEATALTDQGLHLLWDGYYDEALEIFDKVERLVPDSPAGSLLKAGTYWWKMFKLSGDLQRLHTMDALQTDRSPFDQAFAQSVDKAIALAAADVKRNKADAQAYFYLGSAYGLKSQLEGARSKTLASAGLSKKMKKNLDTCLSLKRDTYDVYLGLGLYNYYVDTLSSVLKPFRALLLLPGGDRKKGLEYLNVAKDKGAHVAADACFYLAAIYASPAEKNYSEGLALAVELHKQYPNNPIFHLLLAQIYQNMGDRAKAKATFDEIQRLVRQGHENYDESIAKRVYVE